MKQVLVSFVLLALAGVHWNAAAPDAAEAASALVGSPYADSCTVAGNAPGRETVESGFSGYNSPRWFCRQLICAADFDCGVWLCATCLKEVRAPYGRCSGGY